MVRDACRYGVQILTLSALVVLAGCASTGSAPEPETIRAKSEQSPEQAREWSRKGMLAHDQGDIGGAIAALQQAAELDPSDAPSVNNLALLLTQQNRFREAARTLASGISANPQVAELHYNLAVIAELYLLDLDMALKHYQRYRALSGADDQIVAGWIADLERRLQ